MAPIATDYIKLVLVPAAMSGDTDIVILHVLDLISGILLATNVFAVPVIYTLAPVLTKVREKMTFLAMENTAFAHVTTDIIGIAADVQPILR